MAPGQHDLDLGDLSSECVRSSARTSRQVVASEADALPKLLEHEQKLEP